MNENIFCFIRTLSEAEEKNHVNDTKPKHVSHQHAINHRYKRPSQTDGSEKKNKLQFSQIFNTQNIKSRIKSIWLIFQKLQY